MATNKIIFSPTSQSSKNWQNILNWYLQQVKVKDFIWLLWYLKPGFQHEFEGKQGNLINEAQEVIFFFCFAVIFGNNVIHNKTLYYILLWQWKQIVLKLCQTGRNPEQILNYYELRQPLTKCMDFVQFKPGCVLDCVRTVVCLATRHQSKNGWVQTSNLLTLSTKSAGVDRLMQSLSYETYEIRA